MELSKSLYNWLISVSALSEYEIKQKKQQTVILEQDSTELFEIGTKLPLLIHRLQTFKVFVKKCLELKRT